MSSLSVMQKEYVTVRASFSALIKVHHRGGALEAAVSDMFEIKEGPSSSDDVRLYCYCYEFNAHGRN